MNSKSAVAIGLFVTLLLVAAVGGLYFYGHNRMVRESAAQFAAAKTLYETSQRPEAERRFTEIFRKYPRSAVAPESLYYVAIMMQSAGNYKEALEKWDSLAKVKDNPRAMEVDYYRSECLERLGKTAEAAAGYARVAAVNQPGGFASLAKSGLGRFAEADNKLPEARARFEEAIALANTPESRLAAERELGDLNLSLFLTPAVDENKKEYVVKRGDKMVLIALANNTTVDLLCKINGVSNVAALRPGMRILVPTPEFSIVISKPEFKLTLLSHGKFFKSYRVGLGKHGCTPVGKFVIDDKQENPIWFSPEGKIPAGDPRNQLGSRWMAIKALQPGIGSGYGIHVAVDPKTVGWESSNGCIRLVPREAEELYMLVPKGTSVEIVK